MGPGEVLRIAPLGRPRGDEDLRHLPLIEVFLHRRAGGGAQRAEDGEDLLVLDKAARLLDRLGRAVAVVERDQGDLPAVDAALFVQHLDIGRLGEAERGIAEPGPLYGMVWPSLISLSLTPGP
jgi:hypothetical protein